MSTVMTDPPNPTIDPDRREGERPVVWPELIAQHRVYGWTGYTGVSRVGWFRAKAAGSTPKPVALPGGGIYYRKSDLDKWLARLKPAK